MLYRTQLAVSGIGTQNFSGDCIGMIENPTAIRHGPRRPVYNYLEIVEADVLVLSLSITFFVFVIPI